MKRIVSTLLSVMILLSLFSIPTYAADPAQGVQTVAEYQVYLNNNYGTLTTDLKTFNLKDHISVLENVDQFKCYDISVNIGWSLIEGYSEIMSSTNYTQEQKGLFKQQIENYQKALSELTESTFPNKKIRGGFITTGYKYPNLRMDYYEYISFGWKNYGYKEKFLNFYEDTYIDKLEMYEFDSIGQPMDHL